MHTAEPLHRLPTAPPSLTSNQTPCWKGQFIPAVGRPLAGTSALGPNSAKTDSKQTNHKVFPEKEA